MEEKASTASELIMMDEVRSLFCVYSKIDRRLPDFRRQLEALRRRANDLAAAISGEEDEHRLQVRSSLVELLTILVKRIGRSQRITTDIGGERGDEQIYAHVPRASQNPEPSRRMVRGGTTIEGTQHHFPSHHTRYYHRHLYSTPAPRYSNIHHVHHGATYNYYTNHVPSHFYNYPYFYY